MKPGAGRDLSGDIRVRLDVAGGRVCAVTVVSSRPENAARVLSGRAPAEVPALAGLLFSLCGRAQTIAALDALENAQGLAVAQPRRAARAVLRLAEMLSQTAMRVCLDWPRLLGAPPRADLARRCLGAEAELERAIFGAENWKVPGGAPMVPDLGQVARTLDGLHSLIDAEVFEGGLARQLREALSALGLKGFGVAVEGARLEDGALARRWTADQVRGARAAHGVALLTRLEARLADLALLPGEMADAARDLAQGAPSGDAPRLDGVGEACVETARGMLRHRARIEGGLVTAYAIDAPTDANFAADGPVVQGLSGADAADRDALRRAAELHVLAVDPCVGCTVEIINA